jgi:hypothetical protein
MPGLSFEAAYHAWVVLTAFLPPLLIALAAAVLRMGWWRSTLVLAVAMGVWQFDNMIAHFWTSGMIAFSFVDSVAVLFAALLFRCWDSRNWLFPLAAGFCLGGIFWLHTLALLSAGLAGVVLLALKRRELRAGVALRLAVVALVAGAMAWPWLAVLLRFRDQRGYMDLARISGGLKAFVMDFLSDRRYRFHFDRRALFHVLVVLACLGGARAARVKECRVLYYGIVALLLAACGYGFSLSRFLDQTEPYRYVGSAILFAVIPAAAGARRLGELLRDAGAAGRVAAACVALMLLPSLTAYGFDFLLRWREPAQGIDADQRAAARWLRARRDVPGRVLCENVKMGNALPFFTGQQVLGGTIGDESVLPQNWAGAGVRGPFGIRRRRVAEEGRLGDYLRMFNVAFVVTASPGFEADMRRVSDVYTNAARFGPYAVFAAKPSGLSYIWEGADGSPTRVRAEPNRITIEQPPRGRFVIKYHYLRTLTSTPGTRIRPAPALDDPVPFIEVDNTAGLDRVEIVEAY